MLRSIDAAVYYNGKAMARSLKRLIGLPTFPPKRYASLYAEIERMSPKHILEIGTHDGTNALYMFRLASKSARSVRYYGFDLFEALDSQQSLRESALRPRRLDEVQAYLRHHRVDALLVPGDTSRTLPMSVPQLPRMDLIFIDGGHSVETVSSDWGNVAPLIHGKTVVYFDDYPNWGIKAVVDAIDRSQWDVEILPTADEFDNAEGTRSFQLARVRPR
jgi:predicted O-methyltransferase YrrM